MSNLWNSITKTARSVADNAVFTQTFPNVSNIYDKYKSRANQANNKNHFQNVGIVKFVKQREDGMFATDSDVFSFDVLTNQSLLFKMNLSEYPIQDGSRITDFASFNQLDGSYNGILSLDSFNIRPEANVINDAINKITSPLDTISAYTPKITLQAKEFIDNVNVKFKQATSFLDTAAKRSDNIYSLFVKSSPATEDKVVAKFLPILKTYLTMDRFSINFAGIRYKDIIITGIELNKYNKSVNAINIAISFKQIKIAKTITRQTTFEENALLAKSRASLQLDKQEDNGLSKGKSALLQTVKKFGQIGQLFK